MPCQRREWTQTGEYQMPDCGSSENTRGSRRVSDGSLDPAASIDTMSESPRYDGVAEWYDAFIRSVDHTPAVLEVLERLLGTGPGVCLDLGCGTGVTFPVLARLRWSIVGVDISTDQLAVASSHADAVGAQLVAANASDEPRSRRRSTRLCSRASSACEPSVAPATAAVVASLAGLTHSSACCAAQGATPDTAATPSTVDGDCATSAGQPALTRSRTEPTLWRPRSRN